MFYDGHVAGFVSGATDTDDRRERQLCDASKKSEAVQSSVADPINTKILQHALERRAGNNHRKPLSPASVRHLLLRRTSGAASPLLSPPNPDKSHPHETNEGQWQGLQLMVVLACVVTAGEA